MMRALRLIPPGHRALIGVTLALVALLTAAYWDYTQDDVFITFAYSRNIASGEGFVFNPGERVQGTTTPLYALLMAGVYALTPDLLHAGNLLSGLFALATVALLVSALRPALSRLGTGALAITLAASPLIYVSFGMETLLYSAILAGAFWLWARGRRAASLLAAAALTWTRADGLVLAATLGLLAAGDALGDLRAGRGDSRRSLATVTRLALVYLGGIAPWFLFAWAYFGAPLPQTFSAKEELFQGVKFWEDGVGWWRAFYGNNPLSLLAVPLIALGRVARRALARSAPAGPVARALLHRLPGAERHRLLVLHTAARRPDRPGRARRRLAGPSPGAGRLAAAARRRDGRAAGAGQRGVGRRARLGIPRAAAAHGDLPAGRRVDCCPHRPRRHAAGQRPGHRRLLRPAPHPRLLRADRARSARRQRRLRRRQVQDRSGRHHPVLGNAASRRRGLVPRPLRAAGPVQHARRRRIQPDGRLPPPP
ncbi:MAG: hypothetical protein M5U29_01105 [Anaerolineae bacterium]|nr:hypothetical protein [Anaerolineae bacterium]